MRQIPEILTKNVVHILNVLLAPTHISLTVVIGKDIVWKLSDRTSDVIVICLLEPILLPSG